MDFKKMGDSALGVAYLGGGALAAGFARKKISFLDTMVGKIILVALGIYVASQSKSDILKGVGNGIALNGVMGLASGFMGVDGLNGTENAPTVVQDENGMVYLMNGVGDVYPYEIPLVEGVGATAGFEEQSFAGFDGNSDAMATA